MKMKISLKFLLIAILAMTIPLAFLSHAVTEHARQREIAQELRRLGARVIFESEIVGGFARPHPAERGRWFFDDVVSVDFARMSMARDAELVFSGIVVNDSHIALVSQLTELEELWCGQANVTDEGLEPLTNLRSLKAFSAFECRITDDGLVYISELRNLEHLRLDGANISNEGIRHLIGLKKLKRLFVRNTSLSDNAVPSLIRLQSLEVLDLRGTRITRRGIREIQHALPGCSIMTDRLDHEAHRADP